MKTEKQMSDPILSQVRQYLQENFLLGARARLPGDGESLLEHNILDSTGFLELVAFLEETHNISIDDAEMVPENLDSLNAIAAFVRRKLEAAS